MTNKQQFIDLDNARIDEQVEVMKNIKKADHCPFCSENLEKYHKKPIIKTGKYWLLTKNQWPYQHTKHHFLLIYKQHITDLKDINTEAGKELFELSQWTIKKYDIPGGGLVIRFGDTNYSAGTVNHLHAQLLQPDIHAPSYAEKPVRVKIGKYKK